jgi:hypothetical protein
MAVAARVLRRNGIQLPHRVDGTRPQAAVAPLSPTGMRSQNHGPAAHCCRTGWCKLEERYPGLGALTAQLRAVRCIGRPNDFP